MFMAALGIFPPRRRPSDPVAREGKAKPDRRSLEEVEREHRAIKKILAYPVLRVTQAELDALPRATADGGDADPNVCPIGAWLRCAPYAPLPGVAVVGHVVRGEDAICSQIGAPMSLPTRWMNRYRVEIIPEPAAA
jgi:hypothetical protein